MTKCEISTSIKDSAYWSARRTFPRLLTGKPLVGVLDVTSSFGKCARQNAVGTAVAVGLLLGLSGCEKKSGAPPKSKQAGAQASWFEEVAARSGIDFVLQSGPRQAADIGRVERSV